MRRKGLFAVLVCSLVLCTGCKDAQEKEEETKQVVSEEKKNDVKKETDRDKTYSPIIAEADIDLENEYPYEIRVNRSQNCITVYGVDDTGAYSVPVRAMLCSTGGDDTPVGTFQLGETSRWQMEANGEFSQYATRIVDSVSFQSVPYHTQNNHNLDVEAFNQLGKDVSGASIRLETADAKWIAKNCQEGTKVEIYEDEKEEGPLGKPDARKLEEDATTDPTDKGKLSKEDGDYVPITFKGIKDVEIACNEELDLLEGVTASDSQDQDLTPLIQVYGQVDSSTVGTYEVTYVCTNEKEETRLAVRTIQVTDPEASQTEEPSQGLQAEVQPTAAPTPSPTPEPTAAPANTPEPVVFRNPQEIEANTSAAEPTQAPVVVITTTYTDTQPPEIELVAPSRFTPDISTATLQKRVRITDNSGEISAFYITVQPLSQRGYYVIIYEVEDAAGNARCLSETVQIR